MNKGFIILLNGVSSSGKTSLAKGLLQQLDDYFHLSLDDFDKLIEIMEDRDKNRLIPVATEEFYHRTIAMFADKGINLIIDHILVDELVQRDCLEVLIDYPVLFIGVHCDVEELDRREYQRGDRNIGQGRSQLTFVHTNEIYDISINTSQLKLDACVKKITTKVKHNKNFDGFAKTYKKIITERR